MPDAYEREYNTALRLQQWMDENNKTQADILEACKHYSEKYHIDISKSLLSHYVSGKNEPGNKRLFILSKAMKVSPVWLMGYDVPQSPEPDIQEEKNELKMLLYDLNEEGRQKLMDYARDLAGNEKYRRK